MKINPDNFYSKNILEMNFTAVAVGEISMAKLTNNHSNGRTKTLLNLNPNGIQRHPKNKQITPHNRP